MSELQIALIALGVVVVVIVFAVNHWQERRLRRQLESAFDARPADVLMTPARAGRVEPELVSDDVALPPEREFYLDVEEERAPGPSREDVVAIIERPAPRAEAVAVEAPAAEPATPAPAVVAPREPVPAAAEAVPEPAAAPAEPASIEPGLPVPLPVKADEMLDFVARIQPADTIPAETLRPFIERGRALGRHVQWFGRQAASREWDEVNLFRISRYSELAVALQVVDHHGAVDGDTLAAFCNLMKEVGDRYRGNVSCPDPRATLERAQQLDRICMDVDALIGLNVVSQGKADFSARRITELSEGVGMRLGISGEFHLKDGQGRTLFALTNHEPAPFTADGLDSLSTRGVTLLFDVPRVADGLTVFDQMAGFGRKLAYELGGSLKDDNYRLLSDQEIQKIRNHLEKIYARMEKAGIPPGGPRARRLFA